tara:strand:+ start:686 stop:991 length:306 start_codon:yes stop_codon:yes gene_type:complete
MFKKIIFLFTLFFLGNCASPGSALLGPVITGAKTGSAYQASLSYSSGKFMNKIRKNSVESFLRLNKKKFAYLNVTEMPKILTTNKIDSVVISEVEIIEPLP